MVENSQQEFSSDGLHVSVHLNEQKDSYYVSTPLLFTSKRIAEHTNAHRQQERPKVFRYRIGALH